MYKNDYFFVFVYGTLRRGFHNNYLLKHAEFIGKGQTEEKFRLVANGLPFVRTDKQVSNIKGEVYKINENTLRHLDALEGVRGVKESENWYNRISTTIELENGEFLDCFIYVNNKEDGETIKSGDWKDKYELQNKKY